MLRSRTAKGRLDWRLATFGSLKKAGCRMSNVVVVGAAVGQEVDQPRVGMEYEDDRLVLGEELVEIHVAQPVGVLSFLHRNYHAYRG